MLLVEKDSLNSADLEILFQDNDLIAIDKPAGLLVHRSRIDISTREFAVQKLRDQIGRPVFLVHRLDRPTSGVLLFAFSSEIAKRLCCLLYTSPSPRDKRQSRMPSSA